MSTDSPAETPQRRIVVDLYYEARATVEIEADPNLSDEQLRDLALQQLDDTPDADALWDTTDAWQHINRNPTDDDPKEQTP